jgi:hypothetical protein
LFSLPSNRICNLQILRRRNGRACRICRGCFAYTALRYFQCTSSLDPNLSPLDENGLTSDVIGYQNIVDRFESATFCLGISARQLHIKDMGVHRGEHRSTARPIETLSSRKSSRPSSFAVSFAKSPALSWLTTCSKSVGNSSDLVSIAPNLAQTELDRIDAPAVIAKLSAFLCPAQDGKAILLRVRSHGTA